LAQTAKTTFARTVNFSGMNLQPMPEARGSTILAEFQRSKQRGTPLVMRQFAKDWPANHWTWNDLCRAVGSRTTGIRGNAFAHGQSTTFFPKPIAQKSIAEYFRQLERNETSDERLFAFNLRANAPGLNHSNTKRFHTLGIRVANVPAYFFGAPGSDTRIHYDFDWIDLMLSHFKGQKRVWLFDQCQNDRLYQIPGTVHSAVDFSRLEELREEFPKIEQLEGYEVVLEPGDTLYIPKGYWHHITYVTGSFSITYRIWPQNLSEWLKTSYSWLVGGTDIVLNKIPGTSAWQARRRAKAFEAKYGRPL
jgi:hypothetical protein